MNSQNTADHCDKCQAEQGAVGVSKYLRTGAASGLFLCRACWGLEMRWRAKRNADGVASEFKIVQFDEVL